MGWTHIVPFDRCKEYGCTKPIPVKAERGVGSIWECDHCKTQWKITAWDSDQRESWPTWEKIKSSPLPLN
jgi:ribosomal protein L37AE/L43A